MFSRLSCTQQDAFGSVGNMYYEALLKVESITKWHKTRIKSIWKRGRYSEWQICKYSTCNWRNGGKRNKNCGLAI